MKRIQPAILMVVIVFVICVIAACSSHVASDEDIQDPQQDPQSTQPTTAVHTVTDWNTGNTDGNSVFSEVIINGRDCIVATNGVPDCDYSHFDTRFTPNTTTTMGYYG